MPSADTLAFKPDASIDPRRDGDLPKPPTGAVAVYCRRDSMVVEHPDFRVLRELHLPYIVEHAGQFGVLQYPPSVVLEYHTEGSRFVRGRATSPQDQKTRT